MPAGRCEAFEAPIHDGEVGQDELQVQALDVARRIDAALGMRVGRILEGPDDVEQRVGITQPGQVLGRELLRPDAAVGRCRRRGQVDVGDVGVDDLLRMEDGGQAVEPLVRNLDDADVEGHAPEPTGFDVAACQRVEDGASCRCPQGRRWRSA